MAGTRRSSRLSAAAAAMPPPPSPAPTTNGRKRKANDEATPNGQVAPSTPKKKRSRAPPPPLTPTPSAVGIIAEPAIRRPGPQTPKPAAVTRLADPRGTNAMLLSPETSRLIAPRDGEDPPSPSKGRDGKPATTTQTLLQEACEHLIRVDERMRPLIEKHTCRAFSAEGLAEQVDPFESLASGIISQQVSGAAAKSIKNKFVALFSADDSNVGTAPASSRFPHPSQVVAAPLERLRTAGLSQRKAEYISGLAGEFASGKLSARALRDAPYEEVLERLTAVRGLGRWSVEMFACFGLKRMDVFSLGDLGVQRGMAAFVGRDVAKLRAKGGGKWKYMSEQDMIALSEPFAPYRSLFMWYMWRVEETDISTMET
ncbi:DNA glycosylase [Cordyceps fumosorosea ARSEF 2679]|uniref:DNA glycosylase n=1 Tax=Cordyceps fumosorosea (strain ARSEF 2679) TaxID=1081104 RepID=A0A167R3Q5_CORFA|nr:DNA glycosylase [Cordyceps fumosorosea ARSEF 2679]OAA58244.1 DNA glycosylase [Cordyceps fumosorosea ARSEF 2679]